MMGTFTAISSHDRSCLDHFLAPHFLLSFIEYLTYKKDCRTLYEKKEALRGLLFRFSPCIRTAKYRSLLRDSSPSNRPPQLYSPCEVMISFYLLFLLCITSLAASAPITYQRHHLLGDSGPFPYGKLADKLLNVNDVSYIIDDLYEDIVRVYPENHSTPFSSALPISIFQPNLNLPLPSNGIRNVGTKNLLSLAYRIPDIIKKVVDQKWDTTALVRWRMMARNQSS